MNQSIKSTNPAVQAILTGKAPRAAQVAAASGLLPLEQADLLEVLVGLASSTDPTLSEAASETLNSQTPDDLLIAAKSEDAAPAVLGYLATRSDGGWQLHEATVQNRGTPDDAIALLATSAGDGALLELIAMNQQRLVRAPAIIDAILGNPARTPEAERRARETQKEFFEKERGASQIAAELRARGKSAAAEFFESAEISATPGGLSIDDAWLIAEHIEVNDADIDDSWLSLERYEELLPETAEDHAANVQRIIQHEQLEVGDVSAERVSLIRRIMFMTPKDRLKLAMKGDREARSILIRDSNRVVACAVVNNPRISDQEIEAIAAMRTVTDEALRIIAMNRAWARQYPIIHNLARNPRTPIPTVLGILPRIRTKDVTSLMQNRNVSEPVRRHAQRLASARAGK